MYELEAMKGIEIYPDNKEINLYTDTQQLIQFIEENINLINPIDNTDKDRDRAKQIAVEPLINRLTELPSFKGCGTCSYSQGLVELIYKVHRGKYNIVQKED